MSQILSDRHASYPHRPGVCSPIMPYLLYLFLKLDAKIQSLMFQISLIRFKHPLVPVVSWISYSYQWFNISEHIIPKPVL